MMRGMVHASMMRNFSVTEGPTEKVILGDASIHDACMHDAYIYIYMLLDHYAYGNDALMYDAYIHYP